MAKEIVVTIVLGVLALYGVSEPAIMRTIVLAFRDALSYNPLAVVVLTFTAIAITVAPLIYLIKAN